MRTLICAAFAAALSLAVVSSASAGQLLSAQIADATSVKRTCHTRLVEGSTGVVKRQVTATATGLIRARLSGPRRGDWDLGVFDRRGRSVAGSAQFHNRELAEGIVVDGQRLTVQACRRAGPTRRVRLRVSNVALPKATGARVVKLVRVWTPSDSAKTRLTRTGLDLTEHGGSDYVDVVLHGRADARVLRSHGFGFDVLIGDLVKHDRMATRNHSKSGDNPTMPSGRTNYRRLPDYQADMKKLADEHPELVRTFTLPFRTHEGREVGGVEISTNPGANDGKPVFLQMGVHHAREWPSGEHAMEWAFELVNNYGSDARTTRLVEGTRTLVVPIVNPDGFNLSREVPFADESLDPLAREVPVDSAQPVVDLGFGYKRKNCHIIDLNADSSGYVDRPGACGDPSNRDYGVDPNRNYGGLWGGPGATSDPVPDDFYGPGPFSEPEPQNVRWLVSQNQVTTLITNHTYSDLILRPPGVKAQGDSIDEEAYEAFGAAMADQNGYSNWHGYQLYDTTGTTEDWSYNATGGFGFTFEIGRAAQSKTNDVKSSDPNVQFGLDVAGSYAGVGFHPPYPLGVVAEWNGNGAWTGKGNREAYYVAQEATLDTAKHAVLKGTADPGAVLTISKTFQTATSPRGEDENGLEVYDPNGTPILFTDTLQSKLTVPSDGQFEWHVNPSTRPAVLKGIPGRQPAGPTSPPQDFAHDPSAPFYPAAGAPAPGTYEEREFTIPATDDNGFLHLNLVWPYGTAAEVNVGEENVERLPQDLDLRLYRKNALGLYEEISSSTNSGGPEDITVVDPPPGEYKFRVENWLAPDEYAKNWTASLEFGPPSAGVPGTHEAWSLTCTVKGKSATTSVIVDRGETKTLDLTGCAKAGTKTKDKPRKP